ncbi:MAG: penicillin acylase family protein [Fimbriimonadaceae bacterium]
MLALLIALVVGQGPEPIERDSFGVPHIYAASWEEAFAFAGYAAAQDRLWQMEMSRRLARGRLAEVLGPSAVGSDREVLLNGYTDEELEDQLDGLGPRARAAIESYARGVNRWIGEAKASGRLPAGYAENGFEPEPWSPLDSVAIAIRAFNTFGRFGAGEIRNMALLQYLRTQPARDRVLDVFDDLAWQNEPNSPTTVAPEDDPVRTPPLFPNPTRAETERHLARLPNAGLLELLPGLRLVERADSQAVAMRHGVPYKMGSYAVAVSPARSATRTPLLLAAPQMGWTVPSPAYEMSISAPGYAAAGMTFPGVPGIAIGYTPHAAWALTSGVADTDDIFFFERVGPDEYRFGSEIRRFERIDRTLKVKGGPDQTVTQLRTVYGPVVVQSSQGRAVFARRSAAWMRELQSYGVMLRVPGVRTVAEIDAIVPEAAVNFNLFFALNSGDIGFRYLGRVPIRAAGIDPRLPTPGDPEFDWRGMVPYALMPKADNPKSGVFANWNNKPVAWWPNLDTPAWGRIFRVNTLNRALEKALLTPFDLEMAAWTIARTDSSWPAFARPLRSALDGRFADPTEEDAARYLTAFDGMMVDGSQGAEIYANTMSALRRELFAQHVGPILDPNTFRTVIQETVVFEALSGNTKFDYLAGRSRDEVVRAAFSKAVSDLKSSRGGDPATWGYRPGGIRIPDEAPIPYSDRGTFIQIVELRPVPRGRSLAPPGVAESGAHARDQVPLARAWQYKPMRLRPGG